jgi:hypothetical protein
MLDVKDQVRLGGGMIRGTRQLAERFGMARQGVHLWLSRLGRRYSAG